MNTRLIFASLATSALLIGCTEPVSSEADAQAGWEQTNTVLGAGANGAQSGNAGATAPDEDPQFRASTAVSVNFDYDCASSGSINYNGNYYVDTDNLGGANVDYDYQAEFDKCSADGLTIDGMLDYALSVETTDTTSSLKYTYDGELVWTGNVEGSCEIKMTGSVQAGNGAASISYDGSICGFDASATLSVNS